MKLEENISRIESWNLMHAAMMIVAAMATLFWGDFIFIVAFASISILSFIFQNKSTLRQLEPFGGYANWVTGVRFFILITLAILMSDLTYYIYGIGLIIFVCLDGVDGWLARKYNHSTTFGQYFDMELDALFVLIMCCHYYLFEGIGVWILVPGLLRYFFKIGIELFPKENFREKKKRYASTIAGIFFFVLLASIFVDGQLKIYGLAIGSLLIVFSFGVSTIEYIQFKETPKTSQVL